MIVANFALIVSNRSELGNGNVLLVFRVEDKVGVQIACGRVSDIEFSANLSGMAAGIEELCFLGDIFAANGHVTEVIFAGVKVKFT